MRYMGLDLGSRTLGISVSDASGIIASNYGVIRHNEEYEGLIPQIATIIQEKNVGEIVLGLPKNMNNTVGPKGELSIWFKERLEKELQIPVNLIDERLTTVQAQNMLISNDTSRKKRKQVVDSVAATIILQSFLDKKGK